MDDPEYTESVIQSIRRLSEFAKNIAADRETIRAVRSLLDKHDLIRRFDTSAQANLTVEGVDSSFTVYRTLSVQAIIIAAAAYRGGTGNEKIRRVINAVPSLLSDYSDDLARGLASMYELALARSADADLVLLDGSFNSFAVSLGTFYYSLSNRRDPAVAAVEEYVDQNSDNPLNVFSIAGSKTFVTDVILQKAGPRAVALPKASGAQGAIQYLSDFLGMDRGLSETLFRRYTDRSLFTLVLEPGEYFTFHSARIQERQELRVEGGPNWPWLEEVYNFLGDRDRFGGSGGLTVVLYRPYPWAPAYKVEIPGRASKDYIETVLARLSASIVDPGIKEHEEQFMADMIAKEMLEAVADAGAAVLLNADRVDDVDASVLLMSYYRTRNPEGYGGRSFRSYDRRRIS